MLYQIPLIGHKFPSIIADWEQFKFSRLDGSKSWRRQGNRYPPISSSLQNTVHRYTKDFLHELKQKHVCHSNS
jgi:hypothetical protein